MRIFVLDFIQHRSMRKKILLFIFALVPFLCSAQAIKWAAWTGGMAVKYNVNLGVQYTDGHDIQFAGSASYPIFRKKNALNTYVSSGIDYTGGSSPVSGLNIKPIQITTFFSESLFNDHPYTILLSCDAGYLFNFKHGKDGVVITPNIYVDYKCFFVKAGYDFNVTGGEQQFFVRAGISFGMGAIKMLPADVKIW